MKALGVMLSWEAGNQSKHYQKVFWQFSRRAVISSPTTPSSWGQCVANSWPLSSINDNAPSLAPYPNKSGQLSLSPRCSNGSAPISDQFRTTTNTQQSGHSGTHDLKVIKKIV